MHPTRVIDVVAPLPGPRPRPKELYRTLTEANEIFHQRNDIGILWVNNQLIVRYFGDELDQVVPELGATLNMGALALDGERRPLGPVSYRNAAAALTMSVLVNIRGNNHPFGLDDIDKVETQLKRRLHGVEKVQFPHEKPVLVDIKGKVMKCWLVRVTFNTLDDAAAAVETGVGGRRKYGCGIFLPAGKKQWTIVVPPPGEDG